MACQGTSAGGREHQLFAGDGWAGLCLHTWAGARRILGVFKTECSVEMALASVGKQPICWRAGASTLSLRVSGHADAPGLQGAYLCPLSPGPTTLEEDQPASDVKH